MSQKDNRSPPPDHLLREPPLTIMSGRLVEHEVEVHRCIKENEEKQVLI